MIAGGKYTTYRVMAADAVDAAARGLGGDVPPSCTDDIPLLGAEGYTALWNARHRMAREAGLTPERVERLLHRYGSRIHDLLALMRQRPELGGPLVGAEDYLAAEAFYAVSHEGALHLDDVLTRRLHASIETEDRGVTAAEQAAGLMAEVLGWDPATTAGEVARYRDRVEAERVSQQQPDDASADAARRGVRDPRLLAGE